LPSSSRSPPTSAGAWRSGRFATRLEAYLPHLNDRPAPEKSNALLRSPAFARTPGSGSRPKRFVMSLMIEVVSYGVLSTKPRLAKGETTSVGTLEPGPHRSPQPGPDGGGTWSQ